MHCRTGIFPLGGVLLAPGHIIAGTRGKLTIIGELDGSISERVKSIASEFERAELPVTVSDFGMPNRVADDGVFFDHSVVSSNCQVDLSQRVRQAGAVNTMKFAGDRVYAENFDGVGLVRDVVANLNFPLKGKRVLVLGAGGAVRAALPPILEHKPALLVIANRSVDKAKRPGQLAGRQVHHSWRRLRRPARSAVRRGVQRYLCEPARRTAASADHRFRGCLAYELAYGKGLTPFLRLARNAGVQHIADGVGMLAEQAAEAFAWWHGPRPDTAVVIRHLTVPLVCALEY